MTLAFYKCKVKVLVVFLGPGGRGLALTSGTVPRKPWTGLERHRGWSGPRHSCRKQPPSLHAASGCPADARGKEGVTHTGCRLRKRLWVGAVHGHGPQPQRILVMPGLGWGWRVAFTCPPRGAPWQAGKGVSWWHGLKLPGAAPEACQEPSQHCSQRFMAEVSIQPEGRADKPAAAWPGLALPCCQGCLTSPAQAKPTALSPSEQFLVLPVLGLGVQSLEAVCVGPGASSLIPGSGSLGKGPALCFHFIICKMGLMVVPAYGPL